MITTPDIVNSLHTVTGSTQSPRCQGRWFHPRVEQFEHCYNNVCKLCIENVRNTLYFFTFLLYVDMFLLHFSYRIHPSHRRSYIRGKQGISEAVS